MTTKMVSTRTMVHKLLLYALSISMAVNVALFTLFVIATAMIGVELTGLMMIVSFMGLFILIICVANDMRKILYGKEPIEDEDFVYETEISCPACGYAILVAKETE